MNKLKLNPNNAKYYSEEFIKGFECGVERQFNADREPKMGHWINDDGDNVICSCCNRLNHLYGTYCKHCGAKMEMEE